LNWHAPLEGLPNQKSIFVCKSFSVFVFKNVFGIIGAHCHLIFEVTIEKEITYFFDAKGEVGASLSLHARVFG
jgi:hypothetical protein